MWNLERWYWWAYLQGSIGDTDIKNRHRVTVGEGEGRMTWESSTELYTSPYVKCIASGNLQYEAGNTVSPHFSTLAWKIPWTEDPSRLQSMGSLRVGYDWATSLSLFTFITHSSVLAWRIPGTGEPGGLLSMRSHRVGHDWSDLAAAAAAA